MILIITSKRDGHVNGVATPLDKAGVPWVRVNTEDAPRNLEITLEPSTSVGTFVIKDSGCSFVLNAINAVWYRKPDPVDISHFELDTAGLEYVQAEFDELLQGLYALLHRAYWINNGRRFQSGEGWHSSENAVRFWHPQPRIPKETTSRCYAFTTAYAMMIRLCNVCYVRWKTPRPSPH